MMLKILIGAILNKINLLQLFGFGALGKYKKGIN